MIEKIALLKMQTIAHRGGGLGDRADNRKKAVAANLLVSDVGSHLAIQRSSDGVWIVWHGSIRDNNKKSRSPWNIMFKDIDADVARHDVFTFEDAIEFARENGKKIFAEPKIPTRFSQRDTREYLTSFAMKCDADVVVIITARRDILHILWEIRSQLLKDKLPKFFLGFILDHTKMVLSEEAFRGEEQQKLSAVALRVGIAIETALPGRANIRPDAVFLDSETALLGADIVCKARSSSDFVAVLTVNSLEDVATLRDYGADAPHAVVTNVPLGVRSFLRGRYDDDCE